MNERIWAVVYETNVLDKILDRNEIPNPLNEFMIWDHKSVHKDFLPVEPDEPSREILFKYYVACPGRKAVVVWAWDIRNLKVIIDFAKDLYNRTYSLLSQQ